jgi:hypothetical protein
MKQRRHPNEAKKACWLLLNFIYMFFAQPFIDFLPRMVVRQEGCCQQQQPLSWVFPKGKRFGKALGCLSKFFGFGLFKVVI